MLRRQAARRKYSAEALKSALLQKDEKRLPSITSRSSLLKVLGSGSGFADYKVAKIKGGNGGDGAISFKKAPAQEIGPPAGGNGGKGGDVYIVASKNYTSLNNILDSYNVENGGYEFIFDVS